MIVPCCGELRELKGGHYDKIVEITDNAGKTLLNDYKVTFLIHLTCRRVITVLFPDFALF